MPITFLVALRIGDTAGGSLAWYWRLPQLVRQAADARTKDHVEKTYSTSIWSLSAEQARAVYEWSRAQHA